jgi:DNA-binding CsgD family transcriptional regulator
MADCILASERLGRKADSLKEQYSCAMAKYCWLKEGIENPTENQIQKKIIQLSKLSQTNKLKFLKPMGFKIDKFFLDNSWADVLASEDKYYLCKALYLLFNRGIKKPTAIELKEEIKSLSHCELRKTIFLNRSLNKREIKCVLEASYGRGIKETAIILGLSEISVKKYRCSACILLRCQNIYEAISIATKLGYLKDKQLLPQSAKFEKIEAVGI